MSKTPQKVRLSQNNADEHLLMLCDLYYDHMGAGSDEHEMYEATLDELVEIGAVQDPQGRWSAPVLL